MKKIDRTVLRETLFVAAGTVILSIVLNAVYVLIGKWDLRVLFGNILGAAVAVLNFLLMALTVQHALGKDEKAIKTRVQFSLLFRLLFMFVVALVAYLLPKYFDIIPLLISFFFPRLVIMCRGFIKLPGDSKEKSLQNGDDNELPETDPGETDDK